MKAAVHSKAVAWNQSPARATYLGQAKSIVKLAERCVSHFKHAQIRTGVSLECALGLFIASVNSLRDEARVKWVGLARAAMLIGVSQLELQAMAEAGQIFSEKLKGKYRFLQIDLLIWILAQSVTGLETELVTATDFGRSRRRQRTPRDPHRRAR